MMEYIEMFIAALIALLDYFFPGSGLSMSDPWILMAQLGGILNA